MNANTFSAIYCQRHGIPSERFAQIVLARCLYPHARLLAPLLRELNPDHFAADLDLVRGVGLLRRVRDFSSEANEFAYHPANRGDMRRLLRLRISTQRLRHLLQQTLHDPANAAVPPVDMLGTSVPFAARAEEACLPEEAPRQS